MLKTINKYCDRLESINSLIVRILFCVLIVSCVLQVFTRYVLNNSLSWTEELARYCYIWSNILAAALCTKHKVHASVTVVRDLLSTHWRIIFDIIIDLVILACAYIMLRYGLQVALTFPNKLSPALGIPMLFYYFSVPLSGALIIVYLLVDLLKQFTQLFTGTEKIENEPVGEVN